MKPPYDYLFQHEIVIDELDKILQLNRFKSRQLRDKQKKSRKILKKMIMKLKKGQSITEYFRNEDE